MKRILISLVFLQKLQAGQTLGASSLILSGHKPAPGPASLVSLAGLLTQADSGVTNSSPSPSQRTQMPKQKLSLSIPPPIQQEQQQPVPSPLLTARVSIHNTSNTYLTMK
jgi:hypothetical protein